MDSTEIVQLPATNKDSEDRAIIIQELQRMIEKIKNVNKKVDMHLVTEKIIKIIDGKPIKVGLLFYHLRLKIEDEKSPMIDYYETHQKRYGEALEALEKAGWPCRLEELPSRYIETCRKLAELEDKLNAKTK